MTNKTATQMFVQLEVGSGLFSEPASYIAEYFQLYLCEYEGVSK